MIGWHSIANKFPAGKRRQSAAELRLVSAYQQVFQGNPTREDQEIVLADLARYTGFLMFHAKEATDADLRYGEGMRSVFGHIHGHLSLTPEQREGLFRAARAEAQADAAEGDWSA